MFCYKCGADVPDGSQFCPNCGNAFTAENDVKTQEVNQNSQETVKENTVNTTTESQYHPLYTKKEYLKKEASPKVKLIYKYLPFTAIACVLLAVVSYITVFNTPIQNIPVASFAIKLGFSIAGEPIYEFDEFMEEYEEEMEYYAERMEWVLEENEHEFNNKQTELIEDYIELYEKMADKPTLNNILKLIKYTQKAESLGLYGVGGVDFDDYTFVIDIGATVVSIVMFIGILFVYIFTILGGVFRNKILVIIGMISTIPYTLAWCGILVAVPVIALHVAMLMLTITADKEYKNYRMNFKFFG